MSACHNESVLREYLDHELSPEMEQSIIKHLAECCDCRHKLEIIRDNDKFVSTLLSGSLEESELAELKEISWSRMKTGIKAEKKRRFWSLNSKYKKLAAAATITLCLAGALSIGGVREAVAQFLTVFRTEKVQTITITPQDMQQLEQVISNGVGTVDIKEFGNIDIQGKNEHKIYPSLEEATANIDIDVLTPEMSGYSASMISIDTMPNLSMSLNVDKVNELITKLGGSDLLPGELSNQTFTLSSHPAITIEYSSSNGMPSFTLTQTRSPELIVPGGIDVEAVRDSLISLPFWPDGIRQQLAGVQDWRHTLLIPETGNSTDVIVKGNNGVFMRPDDGQGSPVLIWSSDGIVYCLQGDFSMKQAVRIAESMR